MKKNSFLQLSLLTLCLFTGFMPAYAKHAQSLDSIVATVNDDIITQVELNQAMQTVRMQMEQNQVTPPSEKEFRSFVLNQLINRRLELQLAKQGNVTISNDQLNQVIDNIAKNNDITPAILFDKIKSQGMSVEKYKSDIREELLIQKVQQQEVAAHVNITPQEIKDFMQNHKSQASVSKDRKYHFEDVLVSLGESPTPEQIAETRQLALTIASALQQGKSLHEIPQAQTGMPAVNSNDLGWLELNELPAAFTKQAENMKVKEISAPIQTGNGFHILKLTDARALATAQKSMTDVEAQQMLFQKKMAEAVDVWVARLRSQAFIATPDQA